MSTKRSQSLWAKIAKFGWTTFFVVSTASGAVGFGAGYLLLDYNEYRAHKRDVLDKEITRLRETTESLRDVLQKFADQANGVRATTQQDVSELSSRLHRLLMRAEVLKQRVPAAKPEYERLASAIVALKDSAQAMTGPRDAKPFVKSMSQFLKAKEDFDEAVIGAQNTYDFPFT